MKTITRFRTFLLFITLATLSSCLPDSFTKFEEEPTNEVEAPTNDGGTSPTIPGANTSSCTGTAAECYGPSAIRYEDQTFDLDNPTAESNFGPQIIGNNVPVEQLTFSLVTENPPAGLGFNPNTGEFFGTPLEYYNGLIEVNIVHPNTGKQFSESFRLQASRQITKIEYIYPEHDPVGEESHMLITIANAENLTQFDTTQTLVTENGTKLKIEYIDPITNEIFTTIKKAGPLNIGDKLDNNAFFVAEKATIAKAIYAIDHDSAGGAASRVTLQLRTEPSLENLSEEQKAQILSFTTDPTDKESDSDRTGVEDEFYVCDRTTDAECDGDDFGSFKIASGRLQEEKSVQVKVATLDGGNITSVITYRVLKYARPKSITKVVYPQHKEQRLKIELATEEDAAKFTAGGYVTNERGAKAKVNFVSGTEIYVKIEDDSTYYFAPGDKIDNEPNFFFEEASIPESETDIAITYVFPIGSGSNELPSATAAYYIDNLYLEPDFYFPDGKTSLFSNTSLEESQVRVSIFPNPTTKESTITYGSNLAGSYSFDFCDVNTNGVYNDGTDHKNIPAADCATTFYPAGSIIFGDNDNADGGLFTFPFCNTNNPTARVYEVGGGDSIDTERGACTESSWIAAGSLMLGQNNTISNKLEAQLFQVKVKNALGNEHEFLFKMSFDSPPERLSLNKYLLVPVTKTTNFDIGDYISTSAPIGSAIDCRSSALALSLQNFGGTFNAISSADSLAANEDFWDCGVGVVTDIFDTSRTIAVDKANENSNDLPTARKYHDGASLQKYLGVRLIKGRFKNGMALDNVKIFSSEKAVINRTPIPYNMNFTVNAASATDADGKNDILKTISTFVTTRTDVFDKTAIIKPQLTATNVSSGVLVAAFPLTTSGTDPRFKFLVQTTPQESSCALDIDEANGGNCRFVVGQNLQIINTSTGATEENNIELRFIQAESLYININNGILEGDEITTDPDENDIDGSGSNFTYEDYILQPLNAIVMDHPDTSAAPTDFELFVREGVAGEGTDVIASNPFGGSKYYYDSSTSIPNSLKDATREPTAGAGQDIGSVDSPFGISDLAIADSLNEIKSSNIFYLYKDDPVLIKTYVQESTDTIFQVSPELPGGLILDPTTGEIRGAPKGKSDPQVYTLTAINPFGSTSSYFTIEVLEYFGIELFAESSEPFSYILHKEGQGNEIAQCRVLKNQIERAQNVSTFSEAQKVKKIVDIGCWLEGGERDLYQKGIDLAVRIPNNTCEYVVHEPYQFYAFKPGESEGEGFEDSKMIYQHVTSELGPLEDFPIANAWEADMIINNSTGTDKAVHVLTNDWTEEKILNHFKDSPQCQGSTSNNFNDVAGVPSDRTTTEYPSIGGLVPVGGASLASFPNTSSSISEFEYPNGDPVYDIFGSEEMRAANEAAKFLCSYNYEYDDVVGPKCDTGKVSIRKVNWKVAGGRCFLLGYGFFDVVPGKYQDGVGDEISLRDPKVSKLDNENSNATKRWGPCKEFSLQGTGLSCATSRTSDEGPAFKAAKEACNVPTAQSCLQADATHQCFISDGSEVGIYPDGSAPDGGSTLDNVCHIPVYATVDFSTRPEDNDVIECGGSQNNCVSGPAVQEAGFAGLADGELVSTSYNVVKEDGFDSLGGTTFNYLPANDATLGNGTLVRESVGHLVNSNLYLANYIGHPEYDAEWEGTSPDPNFAPYCAFEKPSSHAFYQATQYDIDAMIRGIGYYANGGEPGSDDDDPVSVDGDPSDLQRMEAGYHGMGNPDAITQPLYGSRPYYGYKCLDSADNVVARIRLVVRDWNKTFKPSDHISLVSPDLGHCNDGDPSSTDDIASTAGNPTSVKCGDGISEAEESLMDNQYKTIFDSSTYNDILDWDDYGFSKIENVTSCFNLNMTNVKTIDAANKVDRFGNKACYGQCNRHSDGSCYEGDDTNVAGNDEDNRECWNRTPATCLEMNDGSPTGCVLQNFPGFNY
jgi:hypothetical protein